MMKIEVEINNCAECPYLISGIVETPENIFAIATRYCLLNGFDETKIPGYKEGMCVVPNEIPDTCPFIKNKKWTLEEARKDFKRQHLTKCCKNCKFHKRQKSNTFSTDIHICRVTSLEIDDYEIITEKETNCKYFDYED